MIRLFYKGNFFFWVLFSTISITCYSQKQDRIWIFPDQAGIDFNDLLNPIAISSNLIPPAAYSASIANNQGNLLFYISGFSLNVVPMRVFDKNGDAMQNGDSLEGYPWVGQGSMIIPVPDDTSKYYAFIADRKGSLGNYLYYSIVDMSLNGGIGSVISRNNLLLTDHINEKLNATRHANGRDWWLIVQSTNTDSLFHKFLITPVGIIGPIDQKIGSGDNRNKAFGQMIFSKDGTKLGLVSGNSTVDIFDFDRCTGSLSNYKQVGESTHSLPNYYHGCSFSPDGNVFYTSSIWHEYKNIYQYDLTSANIQQTKQLIFSYPDTGIFYRLEMGSHLLGPDDKIYIVKGNGFNGINSDTYHTHHIDVIMSPNTLGLGCNYQPSYLDLGNGRTIQGLPNMLNYNLGPVIGSICDSLGVGIEEHSLSETIKVYPQPATVELNVVSEDRTMNRINLTDLQGKKCHEWQVNGKQARLLLDAVPAGMYIMNIETERAIIRKKVVIVE